MIPAFLVFLGGLVVLEHESRAVSRWMAVHEAGHALVGRRCLPEAPILRATIDGGDGWTRQGTVDFAPLSLDIAPEQLPPALRGAVGPDGIARACLGFPLDLIPAPQRWGLLAMAYGGVAAETAHFGRCQGGATSYTVDLGLARRVAASLPGTEPPWEAEVAEAPHHARRLGYLRALDLVSAERAALRRLAGELIDVRTMDGHDVDAALRDADRWGR